MTASWQGRAALVTGADGFIGSHLTEKLLADGARVTAVVRRTSRSQVTNLLRNLDRENVGALEKLIHVDMASPDAVRELAASDAEIWFHLAADAYVPASLDQPSTVVATNIASTQNVLEAARLAGAGHLLVTSSSEVYGSHDDAISESHPFYPATPYAASKLACDRLAWSYHNTFNTPLTIVRPFNCYGPRHVYDMVPLFLARALRGEALTIHGTGGQSRDLTYVTDTVDAFLRLAALPPCGQAYNVGTGKDHRLVDLARAIVDLAGSSSDIVFGPPRAGDVYKLQADATSLRNATGWQPMTDLATGLAENLKWMKDNLAWV